MKLRFLIAIVIVSNVLGNFSISRGMREVGAIVSLSPLAYTRAFLNPWVLAGICLLTIWLLSQLSLLSWADLSFVLPITSISYVLAALLGRWLLNEHVSVERWTGILLISSGVSIVGWTSPRTTAPEQIPR